MNEAIGVQLSSLSDTPASGCNMRREELLDKDRPQRLFGDDFCPSCARRGVNCEVASHPSFSPVPVVDMYSRIQAHTCESLDDALLQNLPFKICCRFIKYVAAFPAIFDVGDCQYGGSLDTFLDYPAAVDRSEVSVWNITNSLLHIVMECFGADACVYRSQSEPSSAIQKRPDDAIYYKDAHIIRLRSKTDTNDYKAAELVNNFPPYAYLQFPAGCNRILGLCISLDVAKVYWIVHDPTCGQLYSAVHYKSFSLRHIEERVQFLVFLFKFARWVVTTTGPTTRFHLVPGICKRTPNGHHITYTVDKLGRACIVKEFARHSNIRFDIIEAVYRAHVDSVEWGEVTSAKFKTVTLQRIGFTLQQALRERLTNVDVVVQHIEAALNQLHDLGYAHCDVKASNVLVDCQSFVAFLCDLEYICPVEDPVPASVRIHRGTHPRSALELDQAQFAAFKAGHLYM